MSSLILPVRPKARAAFDPKPRDQWQTHAVRSLYLEDVEAIFESLQRHAAVSELERLEGSQAATTGRLAATVIVEVGGSVFDDAGDLQALPAGGLSDLRMRTFGYTVTLTCSPTGHLLVVDDDAPLAVQTQREIRRIIRRRQSIAVGFLTSSWGIPAFVLAFPIVASIVEVNLGLPGLALAGVGIAAASLVLWLWWTHERWAKRRTVVIPRHKGDALPRQPAADAAVVIGFFVILAIAGAVWMV